MKKAIWGWYPPMYERYANGKYRILFNVTPYEETVTHRDFETGEKTNEVVTKYSVWFIDLDLPEVTNALSNDNIVLANKLILKERIKAYDSSEAINQFTIQNIPIWLDKNTRAGLKLRFEAELALSNTDTSLWHNGIQFPLNLEKAIQMLNAIEVYAGKCYDCTQQHLNDVEALATVEEIKQYDYTANYPEKLNF